MPNSVPNVAPQLEEGEISEEDQGPQSIRPANRAHPIDHSNPHQARNEPRVYASAKARKVMARAKRVATQASQSRTRRAQSHRANEDRSRSESREFPRASQSRRWHSSRRLSDSHPDPTSYQRPRTRASLTDDEDENEDKSFEQPPNQDFNNHYHRHLPTSDHHRNPSNFDPQPPNYHPGPQHDHPEIYHERPHHPEVYHERPHHPEVYHQQPHHPEVYHQQPHQPEIYHGPPQHPEVYQEPPHHREVYHEPPHHPEAYLEQPHATEVYHLQPHPADVYPVQPHPAEVYPHPPEAYHEPHPPEAYPEQPHPPDAYRQQPHAPQAYHTQPHHPGAYHEHPHSPEAYRQQPHPSNVHHEPYRQEVYHGQSHPPLYPLQTSSQSSLPPTVHHLAHLPKLVPNYPPHYNPYRPPPVQPSTVPQQPAHDHDTVNHPSFRQYEAEEHSSFQSHQVLHTPQSATILSTHNPHLHQSHDSHLTSPEAYYPPQAHHLQPASPPVNTNLEAPVTNQPPYYQHGPEQQRQPTNRLASEPPPREPYPPQAHQPYQNMKTRLVPNYPIPPTPHEFHHPPQSSTSIHDYLVPQSPNREIQSGNQSPYYHHDAEQQHQPTYQLNSEQTSRLPFPPQSHHPQPVMEPRLIPNCPVPPVYHDFRRPPDSSRPANGPETVRTEPPEPQRLQTHPQFAPAGFESDLQTYLPPPPHHHQHNPEEHRMRKADEPPPLPADPYHHCNLTRRAFTQIQEPGPMPPRHSEYQCNPHGHPAEQLKHSRAGPSEIENRGGNQREETSFDFDFASKKREAHVMMSELSLLGVSAEYLLSIGISEWLVREAYPRLSRPRDLSRVVEERTSSKERKQGAMDLGCARDRDREIRRVVIRSPPRQSRTGENRSEIERESSSKGHSKSMVHVIKEPGSGKEVVQNKNKEEGIGKGVDPPKMGASKAGSGLNGEVRSLQSNPKVENRMDSNSKQDAGSQTNPIVLAKKKRERLTSTTEKIEKLNEKDQMSATTGGLRRSLRNQVRSKKIREDVPPLLGLPTPPTPTDKDAL